MELTMPVGDFTTALSLTLLCPYGCNSFIDPNSFQEHIDSYHCNSRCTCGTCNEEFAIEDFAQHLETCKGAQNDEPEPVDPTDTLLHSKPKRTTQTCARMTKCKNCGKELLKKNFPRHLLSCKSAMKDKSTSTADIGCTNVVLSSRNNEQFNNSTVEQLIIESQNCEERLKRPTEPMYKCEDCGMEMLKKNYPRHLVRCNIKQDVPSKLAVCEDCGKECLKKNMPRHKLSCPLAATSDVKKAVKTKCKNCKKWILKESLSKHLRQCIQKGINDEEMSFSDEESETELNNTADTPTMIEVDLNNEFSCQNDYDFVQANNMAFYVQMKDDDNNVIQDISKNYPVPSEMVPEDSIIVFGC